MVGRAMLALAAVAAPLGLLGLARSLDGALLDFATVHPGFWAQATVDAVLAAACLAAVLASRLLWRGPRRTQASAAFLGAGFVAAFLGLRAVPMGPGVGARLQGYQERLGFDYARYRQAQRALGARVAREVAPGGRVALIHQDRSRVSEAYLAFYLCPRIFYLYENRVPDREELSREGIGWILDVRRTSYRTLYREAELRRVAP